MAEPLEPRLMLDSVNLGNRTIYIGGDALHGAEPWYYDNITSASGILKDINPGGSGSYPEYDPGGDFVLADGKAFFWAKTDSYGSRPQLWETDGTPEGTSSVPGMSLQDYAYAE